MSFRAGEDRYSQFVTCNGRVQLSLVQPTGPDGNGRWKELCTAR